MRLLLAVSELGDNGRIFRTQLPSLEIAAANLGIATTTISLDSAKGFGELLRRLEDEDELIYTAIWCYDHRVEGFSKLAQRDLFIEARATLVADISDHPFTPFMLSRLHNASSSFIYKILEPTDKKAVYEISRKDLTCVDTNAVLCPLVDTSLLPEYTNRQITIFFPMSTEYKQDNLAPYFEHLPPELAKAVSFAFKEYRYELCVTIYEFFRTLLPTNFFINEIRASISEAAYYSTLIILSAADMRERFRWRMECLRAVSEQVKDKLIVVAGSRPTSEMHFNDNVHFVNGNLTFPQVVNLYANSKFVVHCHPTYYHGLHERPVHAQLMGCVLVTDSLPWTSRLKSQSFVGISSRTDLGPLHRALSLPDPRMDLDLPLASEINKTLGSEAFLNNLLSLKRTKRVLGNTT